MLRRITTILCVIVLAVMTAADSGRAEEEWGQELLREEFHQSYPLPADGRISLHNINGAVRIAGWDRSEVKVDAVKRATTRERLDEAMIEINASGDRLDIRTRYPEERWREHKGVRNPASVEYTLTIPRGARLEAVELINGALDIEGLTGEVNGSSINGRVAARGLTGPVKLSTINGLLEAEFAQLGERVSLNSVNGQVALVVPSDANAQIKASTVHGSISNSLGLPVRRGRFVGTNLAGQLGTGGPRVSLSNVNGTINVRRASDGRQPSPAVNQLEPAADSEGVVSEVEIEREVAREVEREMRAAQREIAAAQREATQEAARAQQDVARDIERAQRDAHRARRDIEREHGRIAREAAQAQREAERAAHEIERAMSAIGRDRKREEHYGDKRMVDHQTKTFAAGNSPRVRLETFDGSVTVLAWDKPEVLMNATKRAGDEESLRAINLRAEQQGAEVVIKAERDQSKQLGDWNHDAVVSLEVYVPRGATVSVKSGDGRLRLEGVNGNVDMETGDGSIDVAQTRGRLRVQSGDGRVVVAGHEGAADVQTGDGRITLAGRFAELNARTGDGTITLEMASDTDATIETHSEHVTSDGLAVSETGAADTGQRVRRWRVGGGSGKLFRLQTGDGHIFLRRR